MYTPAPFAVDDRAWVRELIAAYPFGLLVTTGGELPLVSHLPMIAQERNGELWLLGHVARANPHADAIASHHAATAIFDGPHAYVSASWYEAPYETVPTWNYATVHGSGRLREGDARRTLELLTETFESHRRQPWRIDGLDPAFFESQLRGIVAFEMRVDRLLAKAKLSQNRTLADRERVIAELAASPREIDRACAAAMRAAL